MKFVIFIVFVQWYFVNCANELPTLYEYYSKPNIKSGLNADLPQFQLNGKNITIYGGTFHYFRVHPDYWRNRLRVIRAAGLNAVETYLPWNLNQPGRNHFDFGNGGSDFEPFLDFVKFLKMAQEEDLFAIVRPGPYICAEWEFGGMPSWILQDNLNVRTSDPKFLALIKNYYDKLIPILAELQFTKGGPIIAVQVENEYGSTDSDDKAYMEYIRDLITNNGLNETLLVTSGSPTIKGTLLPEVLATANFQGRPRDNLNELRRLIGPNRPLMVMEFWSGWFDHWLEEHNTVPADLIINNFKEILDFPSSVNFYMFIGSTNWGFLNGANIADSSIDNSGLQPTASNYDYDAPISEAGERVEKWYRIKEVIEQHNTIKTKIPDPPEWSAPIQYDDISIEEYLSLSDLMGQVLDVVESEDLLSMELLPINNGNGQSYGYTVYETTVDLPPSSILTIKGHVCDTVVVLINDVPYTKIPESLSDINGFGFWRQKDSSLHLNNEEVINGANIKLMVENFGRNNFGGLNQFNQKKGLWQGDVLINDIVLKGWTITPLEFKKKWTNSLIGWKPYLTSTGPSLYKATLTIKDKPHDTYLDLQNWKKGIVIVNGFVLSRHFSLGPQLAAYLPGPLLKQGDNTILVFDHYVNSDKVLFSNKPIFINP